MARMSDKQELERAQLEDVMALLAKARVLLRNQVSLRVRQALGRDERLADLLTPTVDQLEQISHAVEVARQYLGEEWGAGNRAGWRRDKK